MIGLLVTYHTPIESKGFCENHSITLGVKLHDLPYTADWYMNNSGTAVAEAKNFYKIPSENILVFSDDISMDVGRVRMRLKGSDGGQKGLRSIIAECGSDNFPRIKFGVGAKPHPDYDLADWVLSEFSTDDQKKLFACFERAYDGIVKLLAGDRDGAVNTANRAPETNK